MFKRFMVGVAIWGVVISTFFIATGVSPKETLTVAVALPLVFGEMAVCVVVRGADECFENW